MIHGEKINIIIDGIVIKGHIEERMLGQWPETRTGLFVCIDDGFPHFPIPIHHFQPEQKEIYQYGTIESQHQQQSTMIQRDIMLEGGGSADMENFEAINSLYDTAYNQAIDDAIGVVKNYNLYDPNLVIRINNVLESLKKKV